MSARLWLALLTLYLVWGSTHLAIKLTVETIPPILGAGARFVVRASSSEAGSRRSAASAGSGCRAGIC